MASGIPPRGRDSCIGFVPFPWGLISSASKRFIVPRFKSALRGFCPLVLVLCVPRAPCVPLVVLFFFAPLCLYRAPGVTRRGVTFNVSFLFRISPSVFAVCMYQIVILPRINCWTIFRRKSTFLFPLCCAATLTRFSTELWIGVALTRKVNSFFQNLVAIFPVMKGLQGRLVCSYYTRYEMQLVIESHGY